MTMDPKDFEQWATAIRPRLLRHANSVLGDADEAEDTVQDALLKLWLLRTEWSRYRSLEAVALTTVSHLALSALRRHRFRSDAPPEETAAVETGIETVLVRQEETAALLRAIAALPSRQQAVLRLKHLEGMEVADIARLIGSGEEAVRMNLCRARRSILKRFRP